jgi:phage-related holin
MRGLVAEILYVFGYKKSSEFIYDMIHPLYIKFTILLSIVFATLSYYIEFFTGLNVFLYLSIILMFIADFVSGVIASVRYRDEELKSNKIGRTIIKMVLYTIFISALNMFSKYSTTYTFYGIDVNIVGYIHEIVVYFLFLQLVVSFLENRRDSGDKAAENILKVVNKFIKHKKD